MKEWTVEIDESVIRDLKMCLETESLVVNGRILLQEHVIDRLGSIKVEIFSNEHPPPHFRVSVQGETNNFDICSGQPLNGNSLRTHFRAIRKWHQNNRDYLIQKWNESRPSDCPVGDVMC